MIYVCACSADTIQPIVFNNPWTAVPQRAAADWFTRAGQAKVAQSFGTLRKRECLAARSMFFFSGLCVTTCLCWWLYIYIHIYIHIMIYTYWMWNITDTYYDDIYIYICTIYIYFKLYSNRLKRPYHRGSSPQRGFTLIFPKSCRAAGPVEAEKPVSPQMILDLGGIPKKWLTSCRYILNYSDNSGD